MAGVFRVFRRLLGTTAVAAKPGTSNNVLRAAIIKGYGQPLEIEQLTHEPNITKSNQVKVNVQYCSLNSNDVKHLECDHKHKLPYVPGYEFSGEVIETGEDTELTVGQRVVGIIPSRYGALSSRVVLNSSDLWSIPNEVSTKDAAALVCGHSTALLAFTEFHQLDEDDVILIIAGAGGFGLAAVDIAASVFKVKVIALADTEGKAGLLRDRGAFAAFKNDLKHNYKEIMNATKDKGVNLIYDAVGGPILNTVIKCLNEEDGLVLGTYRKEDLEVAKTKDNNEDSKDEKKKNSTISNEVLQKLKTISLTDYRNKDHEKYTEIVEQTLNFCDDGLITAHISKTFNLEEINEAIEYIKGKMCTGKVLIKMNA